jgi:hypothetical protein
MSFTSLIIYPIKSPHPLNMVGDISHVSMVVRQETSLGGHHLVLGPVRPIEVQHLAEAVGPPRDSALGRLRQEASQQQRQSEMIFTAKQL